MNDYNDHIDDIDFSDDLTFDEMSEGIRDGADIEKFIASVGKARDEIEFLKKLKKRRAEPIDEKVAILEQKVEKLKSFILYLMPQHFPKKNSVDFPGIGKISKRKTKGKWVVTDNEVFIKVLEEHKLDEEVVKIKKDIDKRKIANAVARILVTIKEEDLKGVEFEEPEGDSSLVVKVYEEVVKAPKAPKTEASVVSVQKPSSADDIEF
jgi:hypothetical protein